MRLGRAGGSPDMVVATHARVLALYAFRPHLERLADAYQVPLLDASEWWGKANGPSRPRADRTRSTCLSTNPSPTTRPTPNRSRSPHADVSAGPEPAGVLRRAGIGPRHPRWGCMMKTRKVGRAGEDT